jgi:hypothetical protein
MMRDLRRCFVRLALIGAVLVSQQGCQSLFLHDEGRQQVAEEAKANFDVIAQSPLGTQTIDTLLTSRSGVLDRVGAQGVDISFGTFLDERWNDITVKTKSAVSGVSEEQKKVADAKDAASKELADRLSKLPGVQEQETDLLTAINQASVAAARFAATQKFLAAALTGVATTQPSTAISEIHDSLATTQPVTKFEVPKSTPTTSPSTQPFALKQSEVNSTVGELLGLSPDLATTRPSAIALKEAVTTVLEEKFHLTFADQGITVTVISLFYDVARAEELRINAEVAAARQEMAVYDQQLSFLNSLSTRLSQLKSHSVPSGTKPDDRIRQTLQRLAQERTDGATDRLEDALLYLPDQFRALYIDFPKVQRLATERTGLQARRDIALAAIRLEERSAIVSRGLDGLVAFETSGINKDNVTHLMQILHAIELGIIAGK